MAIYADKRGGSLIIERHIAGRLFRRATGLPDTPTGRRTAEMWNGMLTVLHDGGRTDLVDALRPPVASLDFTDVWPHFRLGDWSRIPSAAHLKPLFPTVRSWLLVARKAGGGPISEAHRRSMAQAFTSLERLQPGAMVVDLPELLRRYREVCERAGHGRTFAKAKAAAQAFLRETQGKRHSPLWGDVADLAGVPHERNVMRARSVAEAWATRLALGEDHGNIWWSMCVTGMMPDEQWAGKARVVGAGVDIRGTKTIYRRRTVPLVEPPCVPTRGYKAFRVALAKVAPGCTPYVARRSYSYWLEEAGINPTRRRLYMGHTASDPHEQYPEHDVAPHLLDDGARLSGYIAFGKGAGS